MVVETELGNGFCFTLALGLGLCAGLEGAEAEGLEWSSSTVSLRLHQLGSISAVSEPTSSHINMKSTMHWTLQWQNTSARHAPGQKFRKQGMTLGISKPKSLSELFVNWKRVQWSLQRKKYAVKWNEMKWHEISWNEISWNEMRWDEWMNGWKNEWLSPVTSCVPLLLLLSTALMRELL